MIKSNQMLGYDSNSRLCLVFDLQTNNSTSTRPTEAVKFRIYEPGTGLARKIEANKAHQILTQRRYQRHICNSTRHSSTPSRMGF